MQKKKPKGKLIDFNKALKDKEKKDREERQKEDFKDVDKATKHLYNDDDGQDRSD